ncbi:hypothetical protein B0H10DRAFT_2224710 [Mycena sp. CBHHK59/15]|nr:hypothetical protein B0H10DRAFT_2224710 [Mycena sp. CBHHK59/15]
MSSVTCPHDVVVMDFVSSSLLIVLAALDDTQCVIVAATTSAALPSELTPLQIDRAMPLDWQYSPRDPQMDKGPAPSSSSAVSSSTLPAAHPCSHAPPPHNHSTCNCTAAAPGQLDTIHRRAALRPGCFLPNQLQLQPPPPHAYTQSLGPYFDPANAQLTQWAYQQRMFNTQQAHGTPPPLPDNAQLPYTAFHPYHWPSYQQSTHSDSSGPPPDWCPQPPYGHTDASGPSSSINSRGCTHTNSNNSNSNSHSAPPLTPLQWLVVVHLLPAAATETTLTLCPVHLSPLSQGTLTVPVVSTRVPHVARQLAALTLLTFPGAAPMSALALCPQVQAEASAASVMIRKLGSMGRLAWHNSLLGIMSLFKDKKPKEGDEDGVGSSGKKDKEKDKDRDRAADATVVFKCMHRRTMTPSPEPKPALVFQLRPPMSLTFGLHSSLGSTEDVEELHQVRGLLPVFKRRL